MERTPASLLERLRRPDDAEAWSRFVRLYTPLLFFWGRRAGLQEADAADLVQDVFATLVPLLPDFRYDPSRSFRSWLRTILLNRWRARQRRARLVPTVALGPADVSAPEPEPFDEAEHRRFVVARLLELTANEFEPVTWDAFWQTAVLGLPGAEVASRLGVSVNAVYIARSRVLKRLRRELDGLLEDGEKP